MRTSFAAELSDASGVRKRGRYFAQHALHAPIELTQSLLERNAVGSIDFLVQLDDLMPQQIA